MVASSSTVEPAGRVTAPVVRSRSRSRNSASPIGTVASSRSLARTSGRSRTASTRSVRQPGATCPAIAYSEVRAVPAAGMLTSAAATIWPPFLISTWRGVSGKVIVMLQGSRVRVSRVAVTGRLLPCPVGAGAKRFHHRNRLRCGGGGPPDGRDRAALGWAHGGCGRCSAAAGRLGDRGQPRRRPWRGGRPRAGRLDGIRDRAVLGGRADRASARHGGADGGRGDRGGRGRRGGAVRPHGRRRRPGGRG